ncbi:MAG: LLM class F420-dependent oxidoreductase [Thermoleophilaceae bacterium]
MRDLELGLNLHMTNWHSGPEPNVGLAREAERLGYTAVWCEEAYGSDSVSVLGWLGACTSAIGLGSAIWQIPARSPASAGMTAATLDVLSAGRLRIGLGTSGPQVVEGWHGQPSNRPVARTREYVEILRKILARDEPVAYEGRHYQLPYRGEGAMGIGKPLKLIIKPRSAHIPIYIGSLGPKNIELTAELADGWLPIFFSLRAWEDVFAEPLERGFAQAGGDKGPGNGFDVSPVVSVVVGDDVDACRLPVKRRIALYIGGMGHARVNFSNQLMRRFGYEDEADEIQRLFIAGEREAAVEAVPDELVDDVALCGSRERIAELLQAWRETPVTTIICDTDDVEAIRVMAELTRPAQVEA